MTESTLRDQLQASLGTAYTIQRELGGGGMSRVFLARDEALGRDIVIKVLPREMAAEMSAERFTREIKLAAALQHPHVLPVLSAGVSDGLPFYTMPFVRGESLRAAMDAGTMSLEERVDVLRDVARALRSAHLVETPAPLATTAPSVPAAIADVVMRAIEKDPDKRQQGADETLTQLGGFRSGTGPPLVVAAKSSRWRIPAIAAAAVVILALGLMFSKNRGNLNAASPIMLAVLPFENQGPAEQDAHGTSRWTVPEGLVQPRHRSSRRLRFLSRWLWIRSW